MGNYYYLFFYSLWLDLKKAIFKVKYMAEIDVTDNCNLRCKHCYHFHGKDDFKTEELPINVWIKRFNELYNAGVRSVLLVGGEPALRMDVLLVANKIFPYVTVITNGTIKIPEEFNQNIFVSIDGSQKTNDSIRGKGVFDRVIKNYSGDERVVINMTITRDNYRELEAVVKLSKKHGFQGVLCNICTGGTDVSFPMVVRRKERAVIIKELKRVRAIYPNDFLMNKRMIKWFEYPDHRGPCPCGDEILHFDVSWNRRRCFASNADCSNCGVNAGTIESSLEILKRPIKMIKAVFSQ